MAVSSSNFLNTNDKKLMAASSKKKTKKKKKKERSKSALASQYEQISDSAFVMREEDWSEALHDHSFDDIRAMLDRAVQDEYSEPNKKTSYGSVLVRYYVYKIWPGKVVIKRSYDNRDSDDDLFVMHTYTIEDDEAVLGDAVPVELGFVAADDMGDGFMVAVREVDEESIDDPEFATRMTSEKEPEEEEEEDDGDNGEVLDDPAEQDENAVRETTLQEDISNIKAQDFIEAFDSVIDTGTRIVEEKNGSFVIEGMSLLGAKSKNDRSYSKEVRKKAAQLFEGIKAYCNHPVKGKEDEPRMVQELIGRHRNVRFDEAADMLRSDLHLSPTSIVRDFIIPHAKSNPSLIGNSINASGKLSSDGKVVMEITKGRSVDVVAEPATTKGIYEGVLSTKTNFSEGGDIMEITKDLVLKDEKLVEELREHFLEEHGVENSVQEIQEENEELKTQLAEYKLKESVANTRKEVDQLLKEAKLPEDSKSDKELYSILEKAADSDSRKAIISRLEKIAESAAKAAADSKSPSLETEKDGDGDSKLSESVLLKKAAAAFTIPGRR